MLLASKNPSKQKTEWEQFDKLETKHSKSNKKIVNPEQEESAVLYEYGRLFSSITTEYIKEVEFLSKLQESNYDMLFNSITIWQNLFHTSYELNRNFLSYDISENIFFKLFFK